MGLKSAQVWQRWESGERQPRKARLGDIAKALGVTQDELLQTRSSILSRPEEGEGTVTPLPGLVAVYGMAAGQGERISIAAGTELRWVPMHPAQRGYRQIGAAEVVGESMYPRYKPRELAYFVFNMTPPRGDDVIVELHNGEAMIKEYQGQKDGQVFLKEWFPEERVFSISGSTVKALHAVVG